MDTGEVTWSVTAPTPPAGWWVPAVTGVLAFLVSASAVLPRITWSRRIAFGFNVLSTTVHEAGHALAGCVTGGGVWVIQVHTPDSGVTHTWYPTRLSSIAISMAGYVAPPLAGLGAARLLSRGHAPMVLALTVAAMVLILIVTRDVITLACVVTIGVVAAVTLYWGPVWVQHWVAYTETWLLLLGETSGVWAILHPRIRRDSIAPDDDASDLACETGIPGLVWIAGWAALIGWAVWTAVPLMWP